MIADGFLMPEPSGLDPADSGSAEFDVGTVAALADAAACTHDIDRDGSLDTRTFTLGEALVVATDLDVDGQIDRLTAFERDGDYVSWQFHRDADGTERWERIDHGRLGG